jgi:hypothetical protein
MTKYYIHDGEKQLGAFDKEELKAFKIQKHTPIWFEPLKDWTTAGEVEDLKDIFENTPPEFKVPQIEEEEKKGVFQLPFNKKYVYAILSVISIFLIVVFFYKSSGGSVSSIEENNQNNSTVQELTSEDENYNNSTVQELSTEDNLPNETVSEKSADELRDVLLAKEQNKPLKYITIGASAKVNRVKTRNGTLFRSSKHKNDGVLIEGIISNSATLATFKDIVYRVNYLTNTGTIIDNEDFTIYEFLYPSNYLSVKQKIYPPEGTASVSFEIIKASHD